MMSKKSSPWQNGFQESFYSNFKLELGNVRRFSHVGELIEAVHQQIGYYNTPAGRVQAGADEEDHQGRRRHEDIGDSLATDPET